MLEIFIMVMLWRKLGSIAEDRDRSRQWGWFGPGGWLVGEILGAIIGVMVAEAGAVVYVCALVGAVLGAAGAWLIVSRLAPGAPLVDHAAFD